MGLIQHMKYAPYAPRVLSNKGKTPLYLIFFATSYCNLRCSHCFYWKELNVKREELKLDEIEKIAKTMDNLMFLRLTGGEPMLRKDIPEIIKIFYDNNNLRNVGINTAGFFTQRILSDAKRALELCPGLELEVCISIDDMESHHDQNRGVANTYKNAMATLKGLKELRDAGAKLRINVGLCVTKANQDRLEEIFEKVLVPLGTDFIQVNIIRGTPKEATLSEVDMTKYQAMLKRVRAYNSRKQHHGLYMSSNIKDKVMSSIIVKTIKERQFQGMYCNAGDKVGVLYSTGDLFPCELLEDKKIGNLRESNYDFRGLWNSARGQEVRDWIRDTKCFCTHECFLTANILLDPKNMITMGAHYLKSKFTKDADIKDEQKHVEHIVRTPAPVAEAKPSIPMFVPKQ